ncbi:MAG TPA: serine hydrolase domain-containing protein [Actinomycetota bacterium]|nr:serine hydrolase domain-containing protein [Actinomycetota bacterium]
MKAHCTLVALMLVLAACGPVAQVSTAPAGEMASIVEAWRKRTPVPGVVAIVSAGPDGIQAVASGTLVRDGRRRVTVDTPFRAASITKLLVATVVMQLREEGRLSLDDPVSRHLPQAGPIGRLLDGVTVGDLLAHTSGLPDASRSTELKTSLLEDPDRTWSVDQVLAIAAKGEPEFQAGSAYGYSNTNYLLLGKVIENLTGRPWQAEVRHRILDPTGMEASYLAGFEDPTGELAPGYFDLDNDGFTELVPDPWPALETSEDAAGALVSTAPDLVRFLEAFAGGRLVPKRVVAEMTRPGRYSGRHTGYGLGVEVQRPDLETTVWGHGGLLPGHRSVLWHVPSKNLTVVVLTNESRSRLDGLAELLLRAAAR